MERVNTFNTGRLVELLTEYGIACAVPVLGTGGNAEILPCFFIEDESAFYEIWLMVEQKDRFYAQRLVDHPDVELKKYKPLLFCPVIFDLPVHICYGAPPKTWDRIPWGVEGEIPKLWLEMQGRVGMKGITP